nr:hypothetical protein [uncultured Albidiferax sp.]
MQLTTSLRKARPVHTKAPVAGPEVHPAFKFLNTSLGTWVLSALFLTLGPFIWQQWEDHFKQKAAIQAESYRRSRLIEEFSYRLSLTYARLEALLPKVGEPNTSQESRESVTWALGPLFKVNDSAVPLFRENKDLSGVQLIAEINISFANAPNREEPDSKKQIRHLRRHIDALSKITIPFDQQGKPTQSVKGLLSELHGEVDHNLWGSTGYSFLPAPKGEK